MKVITAIGNPELNNKLQKVEEIEVIGKDIQYQDVLPQTACRLLPGRKYLPSRNGNSGYP